MNIVHHHSWPEIFRYFVAMQGILLLGVNLALIRHSQTVFARPTRNFWLVTLIGKTILTALICGILLEASGPLEFWRTPVACLGFTTVLYGLIRVYHRSRWSKL